MPTTYGLGATEIVAEPGFTATRDDNGGWSGTHRFTVKRELWATPSGRAQFARTTPITLLDASLPSFYSFLVINDFTVTNEECEWVSISVNLSGSVFATYPSGDAAEPEAPTYQLDGALEEAPFSDHKKWKDLTSKQKSFLGDLLNGVIVWDMESQTGQIPAEDGGMLKSDKRSAEITDDAAKFADLISQGQSTYKRPAFTWSEHASGNSKLSANQINDLGKISTPRGSPPEPTGERNWMLTSASQTERAGVYSTSVTWTLSEKGGHDEFLYD
jgi:hypothetical protein